MIPGRPAKWGALGEYLRTLYPGRPFPLVALVAAYLDESFEGGLFSVAGYIASVDTWDNLFSPAWARIIQEAPHKITEFKTSDCRQGKEEFGPPWTKEECKALTVRIVDELTSTRVYPATAICGIGACMGFSAEAITPDILPVYKRLAYSLCMSGITTGASVVCSRYFRDAEALQVIFDTPNQEHRALLDRVFTDTCDLLSKGLPNCIRFKQPIQWGHSHELAGLQAADLLAYETRKEVSNWNLPPRRTLSVALERLIKSRPHVAMLYDDRRVLENFKRLQDGAPLDEDYQMIYDSTDWFRVEAP